MGPLASSSKQTCAPCPLASSTRKESRPTSCSSTASPRRKPWTSKLWIYDLHLTLKENTLKRSDLDDFVACYNPKNRHERKNPSASRASPTKSLPSAINSTSTSSGSKTNHSKTARISPIPTSSPPKSSKTSKPLFRTSPQFQLI